MVEKNIMKPKSMGREKREPREFDERVIEVARVSRVVKGGRRIRFRALVVIGDRKGRIGMGVAKAGEVAEAVRKAVALAKKHLVTVPVINGTVPHEVYSKFGSARVMLKPAAPGTTIVAGGSVRVVAELAGITDLLSKIMGSSNKINNVTATIKALNSFNPEVVAKMRHYDSLDKRIATTTEIAQEDESTELKTTVNKEEKPARERKATKKEAAPAVE